MDLDAMLEALLRDSSGPLKERFAHKHDQTASEFMLEQVKTEIHEFDPGLDPESTGFRIAVVLMSAVVVAGPHVDLLVKFTGYSMTFVADIAHQMRAHGLWTDSEVCADHWFKGDNLTPGFWLDCLVAEGPM